MKFKMVRENFNVTDPDSALAICEAHPLSARHAASRRRTARTLSAVTVLLALSIVFFAAGCGAETKNSEYGVFLSATGDLDSLSGFHTVVIDAQYFSKAEIDAFRAAGHTVYSYINIGSIETFRDYYSQYKDLALGAYENWDEEFWIDVSDSRWQVFLIEELIPSLLEKDVDGFLVDNCDVYFLYPTAQILDGLSTVMRALVGTGRAVLINGGDVYLDAYCGSGGQWNDVITGINQESVFSKILWDEDAFGAASREDREYFQDYIERYAAKGADIYLLEYTRDHRLIREIRDYCQRNGFNYYVSDSVELD